ncbi:hypothetical protein RUM44_013045 [Polyplax serrata]|uniref:H15 domain-containing protein n=1 Tax=Polyplax serrata TaxID=468196 RepID=A0ABR1BD27_POLSC
MDFDMAIASDEGHSPDPLFSSIINAMNSMKEATADKIYQKIQREGSTNYSKPQVDRALACALKYGIFEVKNNRYRVRDDVLDDVDTVYWKMHTKREQTPFRVQDDTSERPLGQRLDPEKDNLRFKKISHSEVSECPQCGRAKRPSPEMKDSTNVKHEKKESYKKNKDNVKGQKKRNSKNSQSSDEKDAENAEFTRGDSKRKFRSSSPEKNVKQRRLLGLENEPLYNGDQCYFMSGGGKYDTTDESELDSMSLVSDDEQSFGSYKVKKSTKPKQKFNKICRLDSKYRSTTLVDDTENTGEGRSKDSLKSESDSDLSSITNDPSKTDFDTKFCDNMPFTSKDSRINDQSQFFIRGKTYGREETDECGLKSESIGCSDEPSGAVIQTNNLLTIEPMESMAFKGPEHTSYIS